MDTLGKDFKAAFDSVWAVIGVLTSAVAVFNWLSGVLNIRLSALIAQLLNAFRSVFHPIIEALTGWAIPWLPFLALPEWKDGLVLWIAVGGAVSRTFLNLARSVGPNFSSRLRPYTGNVFGFAFGFLTSFALWPLMLIRFFDEPIVSRYTRHKETGPGTLAPLIDFSRKVRRYKTFGAYRRAREVADGDYDHDLRVVFAVQLAAVISVVVCLVLLNAAGAS